MKKNSHQDTVRKLGVLEKMLASDDAIKAVVARASKKTPNISNPNVRLRHTARRIIAYYSNLSAAGGAAATLPALIPVVGKVFSIFGAAASDALLTLKFEVEMTLALSSLMGYDIADPRERHMSIILACAALENSRSSDEDFHLFEVIDMAMTEYSSRNLSKMMIRFFARAMITLTAKRWLRFFPVVGAATGAAMNKIQTRSTGLACYLALRHRKRAGES
ncbi:MAG: EcsC family protein [Proteobacteria bacterium]|nr:EcsC family protein [Pseudomonadota bacterium]